MESINVTGGAVEDMHEHRFGRLLCGTDRKSREKGLKRVKVFMQAKEAITVDDCVKLWKGLWYAMFLADKPLVQEELADNLAAMVHVLNDNVAIVYIQCFYVTLLREWGLIDHHRLDKFYLLLDRMLYHGWLWLQRSKWDGDKVEQYLDLLCMGVFSDAATASASGASGVRLHLASHVIGKLEEMTNGRLKYLVKIKKRAAAGGEKEPDTSTVTEAPQDVVEGLIHGLILSTAGSSHDVYVERVHKQIISLVKRSLADARRSAKAEEESGEEEEEDSDDDDEEPCVLWEQVVGFLPSLTFFVFQAASSQINDDLSARSRKQLYSLYGSLKKMCTGEALAEVEKDVAEDLASRAPEPVPDTEEEEEQDGDEGEEEAEMGDLDSDEEGEQQLPPAPDTSSKKGKKRKKSGAGLAEESEFESSSGVVPAPVIQSPVVAAAAAAPDTGGKKGKKARKSEAAAAAAAAAAEPEPPSAPLVEMPDASEADENETSKSGKKKKKAKRKSGIGGEEEEAGAGAGAGAAATPKNARFAVPAPVQTLSDGKPSLTKEEFTTPTTTGAKAAAAASAGGAAALTPGAVAPRPRSALKKRPGTAVAPGRTKKMTGGGAQTERPKRKVRISLENNQLHSFKSDKHDRAARRPFSPYM